MEEGVPYKPLMVNAENLAEAWERAVRLMMAEGYNRFCACP